MEKLNSLYLVILSLLIFTTVTPVSAEELILADEGSYEVGYKLVTLKDDTRDDHVLPIAIWYPAFQPENGNQPTYLGWTNAEPNLSNGPYPLVIYSYWLGGDYLFDSAILRHLASYGFVVVSVEHGCDSLPLCSIDRPADIHYVIEKLGAEDSILAGTIDGETVGLLGISYGGYTSLAAAGADLNPQNWYAWGEAQQENPILGSMAQSTLEHWDEITAYAEQLGIVQSEDHWAFPTDDRIKAVLAGVPANPYMYRANGLNSVTVPTMVFASTGDEFFSYDQLMVPLYSQIGAEEHHILSFIDYGHHIEWSETGEEYYKEFSVAFFGQYLAGELDYAEYMTSDYVDQFDDLTLVKYEGEYACHNGCLDFPTIGQFFASVFR